MTKKFEKEFLKMKSVKNILNELIIKVAAICIEKHIPAEMIHERFDFSSTVSNRSAELFANVISVLKNYSIIKSSVSSYDAIERRVDNADEFENEVETAFKKDVENLPAVLADIETKIDPSLTYLGMHKETLSIYGFFTANRLNSRFEFLHENMNVATFSYTEEIQSFVTMFADAVCAISEMDSLFDNIQSYDEETEKEEIENALKKIADLKASIKMKKILSEIERFETKYQEEIVKNIIKDLAYDHENPTDPIVIGLMKLIEKDTAQENTITIKETGESESDKNEEKGSDIMETNTTHEEKTEMETNTTHEEKIEMKEADIMETAQNQKVTIESYLPSVGKNSYAEKIHKLQQSTPIKSLVLRFTRGRACMVEESTGKNVGEWDQAILETSVENHQSDANQKIAIYDTGRINRKIWEWYPMLENKAFFVDTNEFIKACTTFKNLLAQLEFDFEKSILEVSCREKFTRGKNKGKLKAEARIQIKFEQSTTSESFSNRNEIQSVEKIDVDGNKKSVESPTKEILPTETGFDACNGFDQEDFLDAIQYVAKGLKKSDSKSTDSKSEAKSDDETASKADDIIYLHGHDQQIEIHSNQHSTFNGIDYVATIPATIRKPFIATAKARLIRDIVKLSPERLIKIGTHDDIFLQMICGKTEYQLLTDQSVRVSDVSNASNSVEVSATEFKSLVETIATFAMSKKSQLDDRTFKAFSKCKIEIANQKLTISAGQPREFASKTIDLTSETNLKSVIFIDAKTLIDFAKIIKKKDSKKIVEIGFDSERIRLNLEGKISYGYAVSTDPELIDNWKRSIFNRYFDLSTCDVITTRKEYLLKSLSRMTAILKQVENQPVIITTGDREIQLEACADEMNHVQACEVIPCKSEKEYSFTVNGEKLLSCVKKINGDFVSVKLTRGILQNKFGLQYLISIEDPSDKSFQMFLHLAKKFDGRINCKASLEVNPRNDAFEKAMLETIVNAEAINASVEAMVELIELHDETFEDFINVYQRQFETVDFDGKIILLPEYTDILSDDAILKFVSSGRKKQIERLSQDPSQMLTTDDNDKVTKINSVEVNQLEAGYFNYLRYLNDGDYVKSCFEDPDSIIDHKNPSYIWLSETNFEKGNAKHLKALLSKKIEKLGMNPARFDLAILGLQSEEVNLDTLLKQSETDLRARKILLNVYRVPSLKRELVSSDTFSDFEKSFGFSRWTSKTRGKKRMMQSLRKTRSKIEQLAKDSASKLTIEKIGYDVVRCFINDREVSIAEASYFNYLRYLNDGEYTPASIESNHCVSAICKIPFFFENVYTAAQRGQDNSFLKSLFKKKLEKIGQDPAEINLDYLLTRDRTQFTNEVEQLWRMLDAKTEMQARMRGQIFRRVLARETEDPVLSTQIDQDRKYVDSLFSDESSSFEAIAKKYEATQDKTRIKIDLNIPRKFQTTLQRAIKRVEEERSLEVEKLRQRISEFATQQASRISQNSQYQFALNMLFDMCDEVKRGELAFEIANSEFEDFKNIVLAVA